MAGHGSERVGEPACTAAANQQRPFLHSSLSIPQPPPLVDARLGLHVSWITSVITAFPATVPAFAWFPTKDAFVTPWHRLHKTPQAILLPTAWIMISLPPWSSFLLEKPAWGLFTPEIICYGVTQDWFLILTMLPDSCVTLSKFHNLWEPKFLGSNMNTAVHVPGLLIAWALKHTCKLLSVQYDIWKAPLFLLRRGAQTPLRHGVTGDATDLGWVERV